MQTLVSKSSLEISPMSECHLSSFVLPVRIMNLLQEAGCTGNIFDLLRNILIEEDSKAGGLKVVQIPTYKFF